MERLFSPCTRLHDILESRGRLGRPEGMQELNLDVSPEELLNPERALTYPDLYAMLGNGDTIAWLNPHAAVTRTCGRGGYSWRQLDESCRFCFSADGKEIFVLARSPEHLSEICDVVLRLLAASAVHSVILTEWKCPDVQISAPTLAYLMEQCQSLKTLSLEFLEMNEDHCHVLGDYSRPDLEIELIRCKCFGRGLRTQSGTDQTRSL
jgi:hypothetical protein